MQAGMEKRNAITEGFCFNLKRSLLAFALRTTADGEYSPGDGVTPPVVLARVCFVTEFCDMANPVIAQAEICHNRHRLCDRRY